MKINKIKILMLPILMIVSTLVLTACGQTKSSSSQNQLTTIKNTHQMVWGVKADTKLFGLMNIKTSKIEGFDVDMAKEITKRIDPKAKPVFVQVTSQTRIPLLKNGNIQAIIATMTITKEREKIVDFSKSYFNAGQSLLVMKGSKIKNTKDLNKKGTVVLGTVGSNSVLNIKKVAPKAKVLQLQDYAQALTALKSGQGDALTTDNGILYGMSEQNPQTRVVGGTFTKEPYGVAIDKGQTDLKNSINKAIDEIQQDGTYRKLIKKWFSNVPGFDWRELLND
ncbi:putative glutamine transport system substrate-binding protein [Weissella beninensis]|uniref:Glutamate ABC transporter substrate-binding protein n=1 Tax=Periweissella beninensis TaxID=504936 RepID=A0ABT0VJ68_9LACO|nr:glutamate ABC transporter substrate-binding protein [Periweissella beninensis]MBM7544433.1 putative glutamine transport system substrate-binding protein [Periweissella beninensis]MCM2437880.1 glutamate ABC transporter substrate-binding protein [Periweissella beninensis]